MEDRSKRTRWATRIGTVVLLALTAVRASAQRVEVKSATPDAADQGTLNLNVSISGSGFEAGATAHFYRTGSSDPAGVRVNATTYVRPNLVVANIDVTDFATIDDFDIHVQLKDTRSGHGVELFAVRPKRKQTPPPELHAVQLLDWTSGPHSFLGGGMSSTGSFVGEVSAGSVLDSCGSSRSIRRAALWRLDNVTRTTVTVSPTLLPDPPAVAPDFVSSGGATGVSASGAFVVGWAHQEWPCGGNEILYGVVWVNDGVSWTVEPVERCEDAGVRLGLDLSVGTRNMWGVNDSGIATGACTRSSTGYSVPVTWTRLGPGGPWLVSMLDTGGYSIGQAHGVNTGSGSDANLAFGYLTSAYPDQRAAVWHCATAACAVEVLPASGYTEQRPQRGDEAGDFVVHARPSTTSPYTSGVWVRDGATWRLEVIAPGTVRDIARVGGSNLSNLTAVGVNPYKRRPGEIATRWRRGSSGWTAQILNDLDDSSLFFSLARNMDSSGRIIVRDCCGIYALIPVAILP